MQTPAHDPDAAHPPAGSAPLEFITVAGGCFWCVEAVFVEVAGLALVESGYANGAAHFRRAPTYEQICTGETGFAEVVRLGFNPQVISLADVLDIFFAIHDPTTLNRQGHDVGTQYRSAVYWHEPAQVEPIRAALAEAGRVYADPIVTEVAPLRGYHPAEPYHQRYFRAHPGQGYCAHVVAPKVGKFRSRFGAYRRAEPLA
jgi:peptide-methionine (S)-S-oxide reductase